MVTTKSKIRDAKQLKGQTVWRAIRHHDREEPDRLLQANGLGIKPVVFEK